MREATIAADMADEMHLRMIECLALAQGFEVLWAYYVQSDGTLYSEPCRQNALAFLDAYAKLCEVDSQFSDPEVIGLGEDTEVSAIIDELRHWALTPDVTPYGNVFHARFIFFVLLASVKVHILRKLGARHTPIMTVSSQEMEYTSTVLRWRQHFPKKALSKDPQKLFAEASKCNSIAVVADIRRSQDLMTYAVDHMKFADNLVKFLNSSRAMIDANGGLFDKFTGDGFIAYFNEGICSACGLDYRSAFLSWVDQELEFAIPFFEEWAQQIRKRPMVPVGLSIGADFGAIKFDDIHSHLVAVSDSIVWAARMAAVGGAGELVMNNLLAATLSHSGRTVEVRDGRTKAGEDFQCYVFTPQRSADQ